MRVRALSCLAFLARSVACTDGTGIPEGMARARVLLTDAPFPCDQVRHVYIHVVSVAAATSADTPGGAEWVMIAEPRRPFDLLVLQGGATALVGEGDIPAEQYSAVRLVIDTDSSSIVLNDGSDAGVDWQGTGERALHALVMQPLALWVTLRSAEGAPLSGWSTVWTATDTTVARFEFIYGQAVILRALKPGMITVTATSEGKSGSGTVTMD